MPFLIFGNKVDLPTCVNEERLRYELGLKVTTGKVRFISLNANKALVPLKNIKPIELFMCSVVKHSGCNEGFKWLTHYLT